MHRPAPKKSESTETVFRSGFVALLGRPNVGKSTLLNTLLGEKVAPATPKPQTTRRLLRGVLTADSYQAVLVDTPGYHRPADELGRRMMATSRGALADADAVLVVVDSTDCGPADGELGDLAAGAKKPWLAAWNKTDLPDSGPLPTRLGEADAEMFPVSALTGAGLEALLGRLVEMLPAGPPLYDADQLTAETERELVGEFVREQAMLALREELPYAVEVLVNAFEERPGGLTYIAATLFVEKKSQVGIVVGAGGAVLRGIGSQARRTVEAFLERRAYLDLEVKVRPKWRRDPAALDGFGYRGSR
ncbi:MAG: GTPase Era [Candidatus Coatesbacteria bacterium RBG_13_66_14]|uniref:GTPase Era n=1 Tax=Candidatus Coatesbacteria bacterium RBG_13_66_14 TaxID=1817816 RepID=A0A1F5FEW9_9BACT|nr:MAG: GTPase Era [Candidatus Coatesbacteria bacterium RBG_13_66_14]